MLPGISKFILFLGDLVKEKMREGEVASTAASAAEENGTGVGDDFWSDFDREAQAHSSRFSGQDTAGGLPIQLRMYLDSALVPRQSMQNPLLAWEAFKGEYKYVYDVAQKYVSLLATSVPAECLFSHAGLISSQLRTRLSGKHLDMLVFLRSCPDKFWF